MLDLLHAPSQPLAQGRATPLDLSQAGIAAVFSEGD
jgi:hypothetical protein